MEEGLEHDFDETYEELESGVVKGGIEEVLVS